MKAGKIKNKLRVIDLVFITYMAFIGLWVLIFNRGLDYPYIYSAVHFIIIALVVRLVPLFEKSKNRVLNFLRWWYPILLFTFNYRAVDRLTGTFAKGWYDSIIYNFEYSLLGVHPTIWMEKFVSPALTEIMKFNYFTYYLMIPVAGAALYFFRRREYFVRFLTALSIAFYLSYISFIIFPVRGPRYEFYDRYTKDYSVNIGRHYGPHVADDVREKNTMALDGYFFTKLQARIMRNFSMHGGCMPSSHISAAFVSMVMMGFYVKKLFYIYLPSVALLSLSVVYNRYHYISDVPPGFVVGIISIYLADLIIKKYNSKVKFKASPK